MRFFTRWSAKLGCPARNHQLPQRNFPTVQALEFATIVRENRTLCCKRRNPFFPLAFSE